VAHKFAASGLRAGELFGLEVRHFTGNTMTVEQSVLEGAMAEGLDGRELSLLAYLFCNHFTTTLIDSVSP
jgi:hypothetical protein